MVIGFDASRAFIEGRTGTENYSYQLLKALAGIDEKNKYIIYLRSSSEGSRKTQIAGESESQKFRNIWPKNFQFITIPWPRFWTQAGLALQTFKDNLDVLFVPAHTLPLIRRPGLKTVVTVHDLGSKYLPQAHQLKQRLYLGLIQRYQLKGASKIIAVSEATKKDLIKSGISPKNVTVVYEGYDKEKFKIQNSKFKVNQTVQKYNLRYQNYFLFVGTVQPRKNLERLIRAFAQIESRKTQSTRLLTLATSVLKLVIAGSKGWMSDEIYKLPQKLGIGDKVRFPGYVPEKDLPPFYSGAIALLFPSLFEGFGLPILEAQACGCPVLTSNLSSMPEVAGMLSGGGAVLVNPYSIDDIVRGMIEIQNSKVKSQKIKAGFENIKRFSWEKCAAQTRKIYEG